MILYVVTLVLVVIFGAYSIFLDQRQVTCPECEKCTCPKCPPPEPPCPDCTTDAYPPMAEMMFQSGGEAIPKFPFAQPSNGTFYYKVIFNTYAQEGLLFCGFSWPQRDGGGNQYCALYLKGGKLNLFLSSGQNFIHQELSTVPVSNNKDQIVTLSANSATKNLELRLNSEPVVTIGPYKGSFNFQGFKLVLGNLLYSGVQANMSADLKKPFKGCIKQVIDHTGLIRTFVDFYNSGKVKAGCSDAAPKVFIRP